MKKILLLILSVFLFSVGVNAEEKWEFKEFNFSEDFGMTTIHAIQGISDEYAFAALGNEYQCTSEGYTGKTCNFYYVSLDGKVTKANYYFDNSSGHFPEYYHYSIVKEESGKLKVSFYYEVLKQSKETLPESTDPFYVTDEDDNEVIANYLNCIEFPDDQYDICEIGIEKDGQTIYGIIDSEGDYLIEPDAKYSLVFPDDETHPNFAVLKDASDNYYIFSANENEEKIPKSLLDSKNISINSMRLLDYTDEENYYSAVTLAEPGDLVYFKSDSFSKFSGTVNTPVGFSIINDIPFFYQSDRIIGGFSKRNLYNWENELKYENIYCYDNDNGIFSYNKDGKFYIIDDKGVIVEQSNRDQTCIVLKSKAYYGNLYLYTEFYNATIARPDDWKPKYYILNKIEEKAEEDPSPAPKTTKYSCKRVDGVFYDKSGNTVSKSEYEKSCPETPPDTGMTISIVTVLVLTIGFAVIRRRNIINSI